MVSRLFPRSNPYRLRHNFSAEWRIVLAKTSGGASNLMITTGNQPAKFERLVVPKVSGVLQLYLGTILQP